MGGVGFVAFGLGFLGAILPLLPTTPFILLAGFCFARSSEKVNQWFKATKLYKLVFENYTKKRAMTLKAKLTLLVPLTVLLSISFALLASVPAMPPFMLLDEPTSNLDALNEAAVLRSLMAAKGDRTVVLVSHRASTAALADHVVTVDHGRVS